MPFPGRHLLVAWSLVAVSVLFALAWIVQTRIGPMLPEQMPGSGFTLGQPVTMGDMGDAASVPGTPSRLPILSQGMPEFSGIHEWLNTAPLTQAELRGKVVLIDFWTYSCINCIRTLPYLTAWDATYRDKGLMIIGVHTPEFAFEKDAGNVREALQRHGIAYPVALDNDYGTWNNYDNRYWPAKYLFDAQGRLRYAHFGEGDYDVTERNIQDLLREAGSALAGGMVEVDAVEPGSVGTPEVYIGYARATLFGSPEPVLRDAVGTYSVAEDPRFNRFYLGGAWRVEDERAVLVGDHGELVLRYRASNANLVMGYDELGAVEAEVLLDGAPVPAEWRGADITERDGKTYVYVEAQRLYDLIDAKGDSGTRLLEIRYLAPGVSVYAYTFG